MVRSQCPSVSYVFLKKYTMNIKDLIVVSLSMFQLGNHLESFMAELEGHL